MRKQRNSSLGLSQTPVNGGASRNDAQPGQHTAFKRTPEEMGAPEVTPGCEIHTLEKRLSCDELGQTNKNGAEKAQVVARNKTMRTQNKKSANRVSPGEVITAVEPASNQSADSAGERPLPKLAYTMEETAQMLGISYCSVWRLLQRGLLKSSKALRHKVIPMTEIQRFLKVTTE
jgi:hypothetical protein